MAHVVPEPGGIELQEQPRAASLERSSAGAVGQLAQGARSDRLVPDPEQAHGDEAVVDETGVPKLRGALGLEAGGVYGSRQRVAEAIEYRGQLFGPDGDGQGVAGEERGRLLEPVEVHHGVGFAIFPRVSRIVAGGRPGAALIRAREDGPGPAGL